MPDICAEHRYIPLPARLGNVIVRARLFEEAGDPARTSRVTVASGGRL